MDNNERIIGRKINPVVFVVALIEVAICIVMIVVFANFLKENATKSQVKDFKHEVAISNLNNTVPGLSKDSVKNLMFYLNDIVWLNNTELPSIINASVREGSATVDYFRASDTYVAKFIVDMPDLHQTYNVAHVYMKQNSYKLNIPVNQRMLVYCPDRSESAYSEQECRDRFAGTADEIIKNWDLASEL